ncbi:MAG: TolC family protein [Acidobacteriia bacterium]|nr:TolC family protein [Terriglobia bacterium]
MKSRPILAGLALALGASARAGEPLTPDSAVALALLNHPALRAADREVDAARADGRLARSGWLPRVDITEDWMRSTNPVFVFASKLGQQSFAMADFDPGALNHPDPFTNAATRAVLRQNVWDAGRTRLASKAATLGVQASSDSRARTRDEVAFGALRAFWDAVLAGRTLEVARSAEEAAKANASLAKRHEEEGLAVPSDRMSAEVRLAEVQAMKIRAEQGIAVARAALRQALGLSEDREFDLVPPPVEPAPGDGDPESRVAEALLRRPDLRSLDARLRQAGIGERIARSHRLPEIGVGAQVEWNGRAPLPSEGSNWTAGFSVRVPVFDGAETAARAARALADRERVQALREAMAEGIRLEVRAAWADRNAASERLKVAEAALSQAEEALRIVRDRYDEGMAAMVELLGAEAARTAAQGSRASAARDLALGTAALDLVTGRGVAVPVEGR